MQNDFQRLYWDNAGEREPINLEVYKACKIHKWTRAEFDADQAKMALVAKSVEERWQAENPGLK